MSTHDRGTLVGFAGLIALIVSWMAVGAAPRVMSDAWVPRVWLVATVVALPCAAVAGVIAARKTSKWWYALPAAALVSAAFLLAEVAV
jgi:hypothetical protein